MFLSRLSLFSVAGAQDTQLSDGECLGLGSTATEERGTLPRGRGRIRERSWTLSRGRDKNKHGKERHEHHLKKLKHARQNLKTCIRR